MQFDLPIAILLLVLGLITLNVFNPASRKWVWRVIAVIAVGMLGVHPYLALVWAPPEREMGDVYRIIYVHVPQIQVALVTLAINASCSLAYLMKKSWVTDALAEASAEVGVYMGAVAVCHDRQHAAADRDPGLARPAGLRPVICGFA